MTKRKGADELKNQLLSQKESGPFSHYFHEDTKEVVDEDNDASGTEEVALEDTDNTNNQDQIDNTDATSLEDEEDEDEEDEVAHTRSSSLGVLLDFKNKKTIDQTHTRQTYLVRNELIKRMNKLSKSQGKGFKTKVVNHALEMVLDELEALQKEQQKK